MRRAFVSSIDIDMTVAIPVEPTRPRPATVFAWNLLDLGADAVFDTLWFTDRYLLARIAMGHEALAMCCAKTVSSGFPTAVWD